jgi:hypothetical protein
MGGWEYFVLSSYMLPAGTGLALLIQKRLPFVGRMLWMYILFTLCVEIVSFTLAANGINNLWLYRIYLYAELVFPSLFFYKQFSKKKSKMMVLIVFALAIILTSLTNLFDDWQAHASIQTVVTFGCVSFIIISYFVEMFQMEKVFNPFKDIYFVVGGILFLGHSCTLIYNILYDYLVSGYFGTDILSVLNKVNLNLILFYNALYSYAIWLSRHHRT